MAIFQCLPRIVGAATFFGDDLMTMNNFHDKNQIVRENL